MRRLSLSLISLGLIFAPVIPLSEARTSQSLVIHFFTSAVCPACKRAEVTLPKMIAPVAGAQIKRYEVRNSENKISPENQRNVNRLIAMLRAIEAQQGGKPFIYEDRQAHMLQIEKGIPYYLKKVSSTTTIRKAMPVPLFIVGNRVFIGFRPHVMKRVIREESH